MGIHLVKKQKWRGLGLFLLGEGENQCEPSDSLLSSRPRIDVVVKLLIWRFKIINDILSVDPSIL
jgi:hypothetical protein